MDGGVSTAAVMLNANDLHAHLETCIKSAHEVELEDHWKRFKRDCKQAKGYSKSAARIEFELYQHRALEEKLLIARSALELHLKLTALDQLPDRRSPQQLVDRIVSTLPILFMTFRSIRTKGDGYD